MWNVPRGVASSGWLDAPDVIGVLRTVRCRAHSHSCCASMLTRTSLAAPLWAQWFTTTCWRARSTVVGGEVRTDLCAEPAGVCTERAGVCTAATAPVVDECRRASSEH